MNEELSKEVPSNALTQLVNADVLHLVVEQLRKDLGEPDFVGPAPDPGAFEALRADVLKVLTRRQGGGTHALGVVLYRVDVPERQANEAMDRGGLRELAGTLVLRVLQKVITRLHLRSPS